MVCSFKNEKVQKRSIANNFVLQFLYRILIYVAPLIVSPYLTRVIGNTGLGIYQYSYTIAYYFVLLSMLGIERYGQRLIATSVSDPIKLRKSFWSLYSLHFCISLVSIILFLLFVFLFVKEDRTIFYIQTVYVASAIFDITWFFQGIEDFKSVVVRNSLIKLFEGIAIFTLVKTADDLWLYSVIASGAWLLGQLAMIPQALRIVKPIGFSKDEVLQHIKPLLVLSIAVIAVSLYTVFDKTLLGIMTTKENVAYYEYSNKIINIPKMIIAVIGTVLFPRACKLAYEGVIVGLKKYMNYSIIATAMIGFASFWGLMATANAIAILYYGKDFAVCGSVIMALSPNILIIELGGILRAQYLIPKQMDKEYTICICLNAAINLVLSIALIPACGIYGAIIGTTAAELFGLIYQMRLSKEVILWKDLCKECFPFCIIGFAMFLILRVLTYFMDMSIINLVIQVVVGTFAFSVMTFAYLMLFRREFGYLLLGKAKSLLHIK